MTENQQSHVELSVGEKEETSGRTYIAIDLKSFYASVECLERHLDPLTTNLVVADPDRTEKTICLIHISNTSLKLQKMGREKGKSFRRIVLLLPHLMQMH